MLFFRSKKEEVEINKKKSSRAKLDQGSNVICTIKYAKSFNYNSINFNKESVLLKHFKV